MLKAILCSSPYAFCAVYQICSVGNEYSQSFQIPQKAQRRIKLGRLVRRSHRHTRVTPPHCKSAPGTTSKPVGATKFPHLPLSQTPCFTVLPHARPLAATCWGVGLFRFAKSLNSRGINVMARASPRLPRGLGAIVML